MFDDPETQISAAHGCCLPKSDTTTRCSPLNDLPDPAFDDLARMAATICRVPIARIHLRSENRPFCKARFGMSPSDSLLDYEFCQRILNTSQPLIISNIQADPRFSGSPAADTETSLYFYAGVPLVTTEKLPVGVLSVADCVPRDLTEEQRSMLEAVGRQIVSLVELRKVSQDLAFQQQENARSFRAAQEEIRRRQDTEVELLKHQDEIEELNARLRLSVEVTHHHVRNNLQVILALTQLPIEEGKDTVPITALGRIEHHTCSLAAMHDLLMARAREEVEVDCLSARAALGKLVPLLESTSRGRAIRYEAEDISLSVQEIGSLCILVNELITNAIEHGSGAISLTMAARDGTVRLEVCDEGSGFPPGFDWRRAMGTGMSLIDIAGRHDLRGSVTYENRPEGGGRAAVEFPLTK